MRKLAFSICFLFAFSLSFFAQPPAGYYNNAQGKTGAVLKTALYNIIKGHTDNGYSSLYNIYKTSDNLPTNKVWDMYSIKADGTADYFYSHTSSDQCGTYNSEADCYNREHVFCDSWLGSATPQRSDAHHIVPTDGYVNNRRGSYPHGKVLSATWTSTNGSKLGNSDPTTGFTGTVFEPIDEFKGDFARMYFYVATRYEDKIAGWVTNGSANLILSGNSYPAYKTWFINLMLLWHTQDPVSEKEINRNNAIYSYQNNRNPFIDNPDYALLIWNPGALSVAFTSTPLTSAVVGTTYNYNISASGPGTLTITCTEKPDWLNFNQTGSGTAQLTGVPSAVNAGSHSVQLVASNGTHQATQNFNILVTVTNSAPVIVSVSHDPVTPYNFQNFVVTTEVTNDDGTPAVSLLWGETASQLTNILTANGVGNYYTSSFSIPAEINEVFYQIKAADDGGLVSFSDVFSVTILPNVAPSIYSITMWPEVPNETETVLIRVLASDDDGDEIFAFVNWGLSSEELINNVELDNMNGFFEGIISENPAHSTVYFKIQLIDIKGAVANSSLYSYTVTSSSNVNVVDNIATRVYPNPASSYLFVQRPTDIISRYSIIDIYGRTLLNGELCTDEEPINLNGIEDGTYFLLVTEANGKRMFSVRFVVKK